MGLDFRLKGAAPLWSDDFSSSANQETMLVVMAGRHLYQSSWVDNGHASIAGFRAYQTH